MPGNTHTDGLPTDRIPAIRVLAMPMDTNATGDIFGGWLMSQVDIAGSIEAVRRVRGRVVTVAVNEFRFIKPVYVGDLVSFYTRIHYIGTTSIRIHVEAWAERNRATEKCHKVADAELTYVAIDEDHNPVPIPPEPG
ncbi:MAG: acyl-CoA thioesterase [Proteobacteria bacterium]|jgi:acyl-CoA thioesterase YciA|nr:acyl-CoA thioesterase [Pseudomonadota bacterium]